MILPCIALERWNFPGNLDFKGKILAKFFMRSHFLSKKQYDNKIANQTRDNSIGVSLVSLCYSLNFTKKI